MAGNVSVWATPAAGCCGLICADCAIAQTDDGARLFVEAKAEWRCAGVSNTDDPAKQDSTHTRHTTAEESQS
jgi:hypothetical protein